MAGVQVTGEIVPLASASPTFPVTVSELGKGGWQSVNDHAARDAILASFRTQGMVVVTLNDGAAWQLVGGILNANWQSLGGAAQVPTFKSRYFVDATFTGVSTGSASNPFTTIAAAFAAGVALGLAGGTIQLPANIAHTENVVFPTTGDWEIVGGPPYVTNTFGTQIIGTVTCNTTALARHSLTNLIITGNITGNSLATSVFAAWNTRINGTLTLTTTGASWVALFGGGPGVADPNRLTGNTIGAVNISGRILASDYSFDGGVADAPSVQWSQFRNCRFSNGAYALNGIAGTSTRLFDCTFEQAMTFTAANNVSIVFGGETMAQLMLRGYLTAGAGTITTSTFQSQNTALFNAAGNLGPVSLTGTNAAAGLYEAIGTIDLTTPGTLGIMSLNITYTSLAGVLQTKAVTTLDITSAGGSEGAGSTQFRHNGSTPLQYTVTGVTTPGALAAATAISVRRVD
jgi:hypothetical protein